MRIAIQLQIPFSAFTLLRAEDHFTEVLGSVKVRFLRCNRIPAEIVLCCGHVSAFVYIRAKDTTEFVIRIEEANKV